MSTSIYNNNNASNLVDFNQTRVCQNDLEMEEILNEMGFFANDEFLSGGYGEEYSFPVTSSDGLPANFAPISPNQNMGEKAQHQFSSNPVISPSSSVEDMQMFSVPNPIADMSNYSMPAPIAPRSSGAKTSQKVSKKKTAKKDATKSRKRKTPAESTSLAAPQAPSPAQHQSTDEDGELTEEQLEERRQRNREHAKRSRQRKKSLTGTLEQSVDDLKAENAKLREQIYAMIGVEKAESILESRRESARSQFMKGIMQPTSRVLDDSTVTFLKGLRKGIPAAKASNKRQKKN